MSLTPEDVNEIVAILDGSGYDRLDIRTSRFRLRMAREGGGWSQEWGTAVEEVALVATVPAPVVEAVLPEGIAGVAAPLPGTFYRAPQPGAPPFVEAGANVTVETVVGIIETMKLMNPVHAGCPGIIEAILMDDGAMVAGGAVLMHVRAA